MHIINITLLLLILQAVNYAAHEVSANVRKPAMRKRGNNWIRLSI